MWVTFKDKHPKLGQPIITRSRSLKDKGNCFEAWPSWQEEIKHYYPSATHWWDGEFDFDLAVSDWPKLTP